jgi:hypothetical protein
MRAITICQAYPELILTGEKPIENRTWYTSYRGELLIHAGKSKEWLTSEDIARFPLMKFGYVLGVATLVECLHIEKTWPERYRHLQHHEHANGPYCWLLENVRRLSEPLQVNGAQGLWSPPSWLVSRVQAMKLEQVA